MSQHYVNVPAARSWREISQPVKPRAMSSGGRWRLIRAGVRSVAFVGLLGGLGWGAWTVVAALQDNPQRIPAAAKAVPMKPPELKTMRDGVLDDAWLARTLEIPPGASLMELDLEKLQARVLADQQVLTANLTRLFPDRLIVQVTERMPIARIRVDLGVVQRDLLVARDGVLFFGTGFDPGMLRTLPWLDGIVIARDGAAFRPIARMDVVAQLLADAQFSAPHLYHYWQSVSLARLESDRELEVTMKNGTKALFTAKGSFFVQLANFDEIVERLSRIPGARARVDLTLGREVPVSVEVVSAPDTRRPPAAADAGSFFPLLPASPSKNNREL
jgi:cell division protein FtsQ